MKQFITILIFIFFSQLIFAQETPINNSNELGINTNVILDQVVFKKSKEESERGIFVPTIYSNVLTYRHYYGAKKQFALRMGIGYYKNEMKDSTISTFTRTELFNSIQSFTINFGYQRQFKLGKRAQFYAGMELLFNNEIYKEELVQTFSGGFPGNTTSESEFVRKDNKVSFGIPIGIQFYITERISISTEMNIQPYYTFSNRERLNTGSSENIDKVSLSGVNFRIPQILFLNFRF